MAQSFLSVNEKKMVLLGWALGLCATSPPACCTDRGLASVGASVASASQWGPI